MFDEQKRHLIDSLDAGHNAYYAGEGFDGPSFSFHSKSLEAAKAKDLGRFVDCSYAMLVAWGMHRVGSRGPKMVEYDEFEKSLREAWPYVLHLQHKTPITLSQADWEALECVFRILRCMSTRTSLVANSKVIAHMLPLLAAPVDREYTLTFLYGNKNITNGISSEWQVFKTILCDFYYQIAEDIMFSQKAAECRGHPAQFRWDTSP